MYIRTLKAKGNEYVKLAPNYREPGTVRVRAEDLYSLGRKGKLDLGELRRLIKGISRFLDPDEVAEIQEQIGDDWPFEFLGPGNLGAPPFLTVCGNGLGLMA